MSYFQPPKKPGKAFAFDSEYRGSESSSRDQSSGKGLVSFFDDEPVDCGSRKTEWSAQTAPEEDLREGMDDFRKCEDDGEDLKELIESMPHNLLKKDSNPNKGR